MKGKQVLKAFVYFGTLVLLIGCQVKFNSELLPNINLKDLPKGSDQKVNNGPTQNDGQANQPAKKVYTQLTIAGPVFSTLRLSKDQNCVQLVELSNGSVVVDFGAGKCPSTATEPISEPNLKFTSKYQEIRTDTYKLIFQGKDIGEMALTNEDTELTLTQLCTGRYYLNCYVPSQDQQFSSQPILY